MIKSGVIKDSKLAIELVQVILNKDTSLKSVVFPGNEIHHRDFPWHLVEFPQRCRVVVFDGSVFIQEV